MKGRIWTQEEVDFLCENFYNMGYADLSKRLNRSIVAVRQKAINTGLRLREKREYIQKECANGTLCWECANYAGGCSWSLDFTPVDGWDAVPTTIKNSGEYGSGIDSYHIISCPKFEKG